MIRDFSLIKNVFIITGTCIEYLTAFFNSSLFKFCFRDSFPELLGGTRELNKIFFDRICILKVDSETNKIFEKKVVEIQKLKLKNIDAKNKEIEIDNLIFGLYGLTEEEKNIISFIEIQ
jgi:hypothetical protein